MKGKMKTEERLEMDRIERAIRTLIYGKNQELYEEAKERGLFVLKSILGNFPVTVFKLYPELEAVYKKLEAEQ